MISRQRLRENITAAVHTAQGAGLATTISLGTYQVIHRFHQYLGNKDPNLVEQLTTLPPGFLIGGAAYATAALLLIGDTFMNRTTEPDRKPYKGVADSSRYNP